MKIKIKVILFSLLINGFVFLISYPAEAVKYYWTNETAATLTGNPTFNSIAVDSSGNPRIAYRDDGAGYVLKTVVKSGTWSSPETIDDSSMAYTSTVITSGGVPMISYTSGGALKFAKKSEGVWTIQTVDAAGSAGKFNSIVLGSDGNPRISHVAEEGDQIRYSSFNGTTWSTQVVTSIESEGMSNYTSLALNSSDNPRIAFFDDYSGDGGKDVNFITSDDGGANWSSVDTFDGLSSTAGSYPSLKLNSSGDPRVAYQDPENQRVSFAYKTGGGAWTIESAFATAGSSPTFTSLVLDSSDNPRIAHESSPGGETGVRVSRKDGGVWTTDVIETGSTYGYVQAAIQNGNLHVVYSDITNNLLRYAFGEAGNLVLNGSGDGNDDPVGNGNDTFFNLTDPVASRDYKVTFEDLTAEGRAVIEGSQPSASSFLADPMVVAIMSSTLRTITLQDATFAGNYRVRLPFDDGGIAGFTEGQLEIFKVSGGVVTQGTNKSVNTALNYIEATFSGSFSDFSVGVTPEPATLLLLGSALLGLLGLRRRK